MTPNDEKLSQLLKNWRGIEPRGSFEADVWRRIRETQGAPEEYGWRQWFTWGPAWGVAVAFIFSVILGVSAGIRTVPRTGQDTRAELQFMSSGTLAGGYVKLTTEGHR